MTHPPLALLVLGVSLGLGACSDRDDDPLDDPSAAPEGNGSVLLQTSGDDGALPDEAFSDGVADGSGGVDELFDVGGGASDELFAIDGASDELFDVGDGASDELFDIDGASDELFDVGGTVDEDDTLDFDAAPLEGGTLDPATGSDVDPLDPDSTGDDEVTGTDLDGQAVFVPVIPGNLDATRVLDGLNLVLGQTLLDLNARIAGGTELDAQRNDCLGTYDPALGEPLTAVECGQALVTDPVPISVERGAFFPTAECRASLAAGRLDDCILAFASVFDRTEFAQGPDDRRPLPIQGSGVIVRYGLQGPILSVMNDEEAVTGPSSCEIDLATGATVAGGIGGCDTLLGNVADRFDAALVEVR